MSFEQLYLFNYKAIEEMNIQFGAGVNLLIGDNGVGKTTILEAMTVALGDYLNGLSKIAKTGVKSTDVRIGTHVLSDASQGVVYSTPVIIKARFQYGKNKLTGEVTRKDETSSSKTRFLGKEVAQYANTLVNDIHAELPLFCYFSTSRLAPPKREDFGTASNNKLNDRRCGYIGCFESNLDIKTIQAWCLKMEMAAFQQKKCIREYEAFKKIVSDFMLHMNELEEKPEVYYSRAFETIVYSENGNTLPVHYLSAGYQSLLWIIMNMAFRLALLNPGKEDLGAIGGVVLIDEIDMHLHPKWQWKVIGALRDTFPKIQFIMATHSPIIISSSRNVNLIQIDEKQKVHYLPEAYAYSVEDVLELRQESVGTPKELKKVCQMFETAFNEENYEMAKKVIEQMAEAFGDDNTKVKNAKAELEVE